MSKTVLLVTKQIYSSSKKKKSYQIRHNKKKIEKRKKQKKSLNQSQWSTKIANIISHIYVYLWECVEVYIQNTLLSMPMESNGIICFKRFTDGDETVVSRLSKGILLKKQDIHFFFYHMCFLLFTEKTFVSPNHIALLLLLFYHVAHLYTILPNHCY